MYEKTSFLKSVYSNNGPGFYTNYSPANWVKFNKDISKYMWKIRKKNMCIIHVV